MIEINKSFNISIVINTSAKHQVHFTVEIFKNINNTTRSTNIYEMNVHEINDND